MKYGCLLKLLLKLVVLHAWNGYIVTLCNRRYLSSHRIGYRLCSLIETILASDHGVAQPGRNLVVTHQVIVCDSTRLLLNANFLHVGRLLNLAKLVYEGAAT